MKRRKIVAKHAIRGHSTTTWTDFCNFLTPYPLRGQFLYPERGQKQAFFDPLPPHLFHVVIEWPLSDMSRLFSFMIHFWIIFSLFWIMSLSDLLNKLRQQGSSLCNKKLDFCNLYNALTSFFFSFNTSKELLQVSIWNQMNHTYLLHIVLISI